MTQTDRRFFSPVDGQPRASRPYMTHLQVDEALSRAETARAQWGAATFAERATVLRRAAQLLREERAVLAAHITLEMGKPIAEAEGEIDKSAWNCEYVAQNAQMWLADEAVATQAVSSFMSRFDPWAPFWPSCRGISPSGRSSAAPCRR